MCVGGGGRRWDTAMVVAAGTDGTGSGGGRRRSTAVAAAGVKGHRGLVVVPAGRGRPSMAGRGCGWLGPALKRRDLR